MEKLTIYSNIPPNAMLSDKRVGRQGLIFGRASQIATQYGVTIEIENGLVKFTAPKARLQLFAEKLHFAGVNYWE